MSRQRVRLRSAFTLAALLLVALISCERAFSDGAVQALLADPARYDGQVVALTGTATHVDRRISRKGNAYYTFQLEDGSGRVTVFSFGTPPCPSGSRVSVEGQFLRVKHVSGYTFYNQVDARQVSCE